MIKQPDEQQENFDRVLAVRVPNSVFLKLKKSRINFAPYVRQLLKDLINANNTESESLKLWKKR